MRDLTINNKGKVVDKRTRREHKIAFTTVDKPGVLGEVKLIPQSQFLKCPHFIMLPDHYREDGSCKCDSQEERDRLKRMKSGYRKSDWAKIPLRKEEG